jgi:hypothetical protein
VIARWHDALDAQATCFGFYDSPRGRAYGRGWARSWGPDGTLVSSKTGEPMSDGAIAAYEEMAANIPDALLQADTLYVEPDMMTVVEAAATSFEPEPLHEVDLPCPAGFLYLPRPLVIHDRHNVETSIRAFLWYPTTFRFFDGSTLEPRAQGIVLVMFHMNGDPDHYDTAESRGLMPRGTMLINHVFPWPYGQSYPEAETPGGLIDVARPLVALFRLMQQTVSVRTRERPDRHVRRRMPPPLVENLVTVIHLRRPHQPADDHEPRVVDWTHRWLVGGHWRWQPYPSLGPDVRKQIWISPYVKGPEDRPLVVRKARVLDLAR